MINRTRRTHDDRPHYGTDGALEQVRPADRGPLGARGFRRYKRTLSGRATQAATLRTIFAQPDRASAGKRLAVIAEAMATRWPRVMEEQVLACIAFPSEHWMRIYSTNPLERLNKEIKRRTTWWVSSLMCPRWSAWWEGS